MVEQPKIKGGINQKNLAHIILYVSMYLIWKERDIVNGSKCGIGILSDWERHHLLFLVGHRADFNNFVDILALLHRLQCAHKLGYTMIKIEED